MRVLALVTDAFGGRGGIAMYNRQALEAMASAPGLTSLVVLPRVVMEESYLVPDGITWVASAAGGLSAFVSAFLRQLFTPVDVIYCGHLHLLPLAMIIKVLRRKQLILQVHGIEVWQPRRPSATRWLSYVDSIWCVSRYTRDRMNAWACLPSTRYTIIPNTIRLEQFGLAPRNPVLVARYGLDEARVLLTLARLDSRERYKGIDEVLQVFPELLSRNPDLIYLIAGSGDDQPRLQAKAEALGVAERVRFVGYVTEGDKADVLRLADVFVMPGRGEGFGIVYLEAMACGVPVIGSRLDGSQDALADGQLGTLVDPDQPEQLVVAIREALSLPRQILPGLSRFAWPSFQRRVQDAVGSFSH